MLTISLKQISDQIMRMDISKQVMMLFFSCTSGVSTLGIWGSAENKWVNFDGDQYYYLSYSPQLLLSIWDLKLLKHNLFSLFFPPYRHLSFWVGIFIVNYFFFLFDSSDKAKKNPDKLSNNQKFRLIQIHNISIQCYWGKNLRNCWVIDLLEWIQKRKSSIH